MLIFEKSIILNTGSTFLLFTSLLRGQYYYTGDFEVFTETHTINNSSGQTLEYSLFTGIGSSNNVFIILAHGFSRSKYTMSELAYHYATWGLNVITMDLLYSSIIQNDPFQDAQDLNLISQSVCDGNPVIYMGYSAGGIRSIVAAHNDSNAVAFLGLDLVDAPSDSLNNEFIALFYASLISIPTWGLLGESSACNANANGLNAYLNTENGKALRITDADHCDFESPTDILCSFLCQGSNENFTDLEIRNVKLSLSTGFLLFHSGLSNNSIEIWEQGNEYYDELISLGAIQELANLDINTEKQMMNFFKLDGNYPNPFNNRTNVTYELFVDSFVKMTIYDLKGNVVKNLINTKQRAGIKNLYWSAIDNRGKLVSAGVYLYSIEVNNLSKTKKMIFLK